MDKTPIYRTFDVLLQNVRRDIIDNINKLVGDKTITLQTSIFAAVLDDDSVTLETHYVLEVRNGTALTVMSDDSSYEIPFERIDADTLLTILQGVEMEINRN